MLVFYNKNFNQHLWHEKQITFITILFSHKELIRDKSYTLKDDSNPDDILKYLSHEIKLY